VVFRTKQWRLKCSVKHGCRVSHGLSLNTITNTLTRALQSVNKRKNIQCCQQKFFQYIQNNQIIFLNFLVVPLFCPAPRISVIHNLYMSAVYMHHFHKRHLFGLSGIMENTYKFKTETLHQTLLYTHFCVLAMFARSVK
jgi:hypothetical protein